MLYEKDKKELLDLLVKFDQEYYASANINYPRLREILYKLLDVLSEKSPCTVRRNPNRPGKRYPSTVDPTTNQEPENQSSDHPAQSGDFGEAPLPVLWSVPSSGC